MAFQPDPEELIGSFDGLTALIEKQATVLAAKGITVATIKTPLTNARADLADKKSARDDARTTAANTQRAFQASAEKNYTAFSDAVDLIAGVLGKKSVEGQQCLALRKNVTGANRRPRSAATPKPTPASGT